MKKFLFSVLSFCALSSFAQQKTILGKTYVLGYAVEVANSHFVKPTDNDYYSVTFTADSGFTIASSVANVSGTFTFSRGVITFNFKNGTTKSTDIQIVDQNEIIFIDDKKQKDYLFVMP